MFLSFIFITINSCDRNMRRQMHYKDLFKAAELFKRDPKAYDFSYRRARQKVNWRELHILSDDVVENYVLGFLNEWACRIPVTNVVIRKIKETYEKAIPSLEVLNGETLEDIDFEKMKMVGDQRLRNSGIIHCVFAMFSDIGHKFRWVAASKLLHMVNPNLFTMWDNPICKAYFLKLTASAYAYEFMPQMREEANEAIETYMKDQNCGRDAAIRSIQEKSREISGYQKTLAKLVDEYNWIRYTRKYNKWHDI